MKWREVGGKSGRGGQIGRFAVPGGIERPRKGLQSRGRYWRNPGMDLERGLGIQMFVGFHGNDPNFRKILTRV